MFALTLAIPTLIGPAFAGSTGTVGGTGGSHFPPVYCRSSDERIYGLGIATTQDGNIPYILGVKALCRPMGLSGGWDPEPGSDSQTRFQKGISGWNNDSVTFVICPDNTWIASLSGGTRNFGPHPVLTKIDVKCYSATEQGSRSGSPTPRTFGSSARSAGSLLCPGSEIANGFYGKSGSYLDALGFKCVAAPGKTKTVQTPVLASWLFTWTRGLSSSDITRYNLPAGNNLQGKDMQDVLTRDIVVRNDGNSCIDCHSSGSYGATFTSLTSRLQACQELSDFAGASKPENLKRLMANWKSRNCP